MFPFGLPTRAQECGLTQVLHKPSGMRPTWERGQGIRLVGLRSSYLLFAFLIIAQRLASCHYFGERGMHGSRKLIKLHSLSSRDEAWPGGDFISFMERGN